MGRPKSPAGKPERLSLSIPPLLKARLVAAERDGVTFNWSQVACDAIEAKLDRLLVERDSPGMADAILRLRSEEKIGPEPDRDAGFAEGIRWARERASGNELQNLEELASTDALRRLLMSTPHPVAVTLAELFWRAIAGPWSRGPSETVYTFWAPYMPQSLIFGGDYQIDRLNSDFIGGFADGAMYVWGKIKPLL